MMMATQLVSPRPPAAGRPRSFTPGSLASPRQARAKRLNHSYPLAVSPSRRSADLAGRAIALSPDIPALFDGPLGAHHKLLGRWAATRDDGQQTYTRTAARLHIERLFERTVLDILEPIDCVDLRAVVLLGPDDEPPAIALVCDSVGQLDLGWIETSELPTAWRAAAYQALERTLGRALPVFGYQDLFDQMSIYYWDGETEDDAARRTLVEIHGADPDDLDEYALPEAMSARRPDWMIEANAGTVSDLPKALRQALRALDKAHRWLKLGASAHCAWAFETDTLYAYVPELDECSHLPPLTLVPVEHFAREVDDIGRHGMEYGFMDVAGLCLLPTEKRIDDWFVSLALGTQFLAAAQSLIRLYPITTGDHDAQS